MNLQTNISNFRIIDENEFQLENHNRVFVQDDIEQSLLPGQQIQDAEERDGSIEHIQSLDESEPPLPVEINSISDQTNIDFGVPVTIELLQNGITQNVQLIEIQAASQQQIGDTGDQLYQLLSSWDIAHLYKKFKDKRTTIETFKYFRYKHLEHYFDKNEVGEQIPFEHHLFKWQRENNFYEEPYITASIDATMETPKVDNNNEFIIFNSQNFNSLALNDILAKTRSGKEIIAYYGHNNRLLEGHRSTLVHLIVDYYINNNCLVGVDKCRKLVDEIINLFPTETKTTYFIGRGHFPPKGKLNDRFQNQKKKLRKMQRPVDKKTSTVSVTEQTQPLNIPVPSSCNGDDSIRIELKHLRTPWEDVVEKWTKIAAYRIHQITTNKDNNLVHIFEQWPLFKHPQAPELVSSDFKILFPSHQSIYMKWDDFISKIPDIYGRSLKEKRNIKLFREIHNKRDQLNIGDVVY